MYKQLSVAVLCLLPFQLLMALEYSIQFKGAVDTVKLDSVFVENVTRQQSVRLGGQDLLTLTDQPVGLQTPNLLVQEHLSVFPNPSVDGVCTVTFQSDAHQMARLEVVDLSGKCLLRRSISLGVGQNSFSLTNLPQGLNYAVVTAGNRRFTGKIISTTPEHGALRLTEMQVDVHSSRSVASPSKFPAVRIEHYLHFEPGDRLKLTGLSGSDRSVRVVAPTSDSTLAFTFYSCIDWDGYSYPTVTIGNQVWMAENLRTTRYNDGMPINKVTAVEQWDSQMAYDGAFGWYENDSLNRLPFGALYNGYAVLAGKLAPKGWHVPSDAELQTLMEAVGNSPSHLMSGRVSGWNDLPDVPYDSTGFGAEGAGIYGRWGYDGRFEMTSFWTTTQSQMPSAPKRRSDNETQYVVYNTPYLSTFTISPQWLSMDGSTAARGMSVRCVKNQAPTVKTGRIFAGIATVAGLEGWVVSDGGDDVVEKGFCWSRTNPEPTLADSVVLAAGSTLEAVISGLETGVTYYARAFAKNAVGISYGDVKSYTTSDPGTVTDIDNHTYPTVNIGDQVWMAENLRVTRYNDGTPIPLVNNPSAWSKLTSDARCLYDTLAPVNEYGYLYNQKAVQSNKLAPVGWHVPTLTEWKTLVESSVTIENPDANAANRLKEAGSTHWMGRNDATNISGFTALPGGLRVSTGESLFKGSAGYWRSTSRSTETNSVLYRFITIQGNDALVVEMDSSMGASIRCLKDYPAKLNTCLKLVTQTTASVGATLIEAGGVLTRSGLCWSATAAVPDVNNAQVVLLDSMEIKGEQWLDLDTLTPGATYHLRAFAENSTGVSYGPLLTFSTQSGDTLVDADGNTYHTIKIGTQTWMVENLKTTKYNDGTPIGGISGYHSTTPGCTVYAGNSSNKATYGLLYNWYAVNTGKLAPKGWRVPTLEDWQTLVNYLGDSETAGGKLKESGLGHWESPNTGAIDWGFKALPGGTRDGSAAYFRTLRSRGWWWASTQGTEDYNACTMELVSWMSSVSLGQGYKSDAFSVRCIKEE